MTAPLSWKVVSPQRVPAYYSGRVQNVLIGHAELNQVHVVAGATPSRHGLGVFHQYNHQVGEGFIHYGKYYYRPTLKDWRNEDPVAYNRKFRRTILSFPCYAPYQIYVEAHDYQAAFRVTRNPQHTEPLTGKQFIRELENYLGAGHFSLVGNFTAKQLSTSYIAGPPENGDYIINTNQEKRLDKMWMDYTFVASFNEKIEYPVDFQSNKMIRYTSGPITAQAAGFLYFTTNAGGLNEPTSTRNQPFFSGEEKIPHIHFRHPAMSPEDPLTHFHGNVNGEIVHINMNDTTLLDQFEFLVYQNNALIDTNGK